MPKFRKKPVVIEAIQFTGDKEVTEKIYELSDEDNIYALGIPAHALNITTLEGTMTALPGDWIIKGVNGEVYPCKPDIFEKTYEPA